MSVKAEGSAPAWAHVLADGVTREMDRLQKRIAELEKRIKALENP